MPLLSLQFLVLAACVLGCGIVLSRSADALGRILGLGGSMAGFLLLAGATSLPELVMSTHAARLGEPSMAVGDLLGSCLFNLLILGVLDLVSRSKERMLSSRSAMHGLSAMAGIVLAAIAGGGVVLGVMRPPATWPAWWPQWIGPTSLLLLLAYVTCLKVILADVVTPLEPASDPADEPDPRRDRNALLSYIAATVALLLVGPPTAAVAIRFAEQTGLGGTFVGTTFVAAMTSLPEVVTTWVALRMKAPDLAVGNVLGSNAFNLVAIAAVDAMSLGPLLAEAGLVHAMTACCVILVTAVASLGLLSRSERRIGLFEPDACAVVTLSIAGFAIVYALG